MLTKLRTGYLALLDWGRIVGNALLGSAMLAVFGVGVFKITIASKGLLIASWTLDVRGLGSEEQAVTAVTELLKGLEYFFLAPLGLLTFRALSRYVRAQIADPKRDDAAIARGEAERDVHHLKALIGTLISALLLTDLVSKVVHTTPRTEFSYLLGELSVLVASILYVVSLPRSQNL